jgi:hypothetical protein
MERVEPRTHADTVVDEPPPLGLGRSPGLGLDNFQAVDLIGALLLSIGAASLLLGIVLFLNSRQHRKAGDPVDSALLG